MKAAIYNPYLDSLGGGERYTMAVATKLAKMGYKVDVEWKDEGISKELEKRFGIDLSKISIVDSINRGDGYDVCFWVSDGSIPMLRSRNNLLHFQIPFTGVNGKTLLNKMKFYRINHIVCNSEFTKSFIDKEYGVDSEVLYPPVDTEHFTPGRKENVILSVGRFSQLTQSKNQHVLVDAYKEMYDSGMKKYKLILAGGSDVGVDRYVKKLRDSAKGYPVRIIEGPSFAELIKLYRKAKIFWSASGYGVDEKKEPKKVEHFGIVTVEAMSAGAVPIVTNLGGHKEVVDGGNGELWDTKSDLIDKTRDLINNTKELKKMSKKAIQDSAKYSYGIFESNLSKMAQ